MVCYGNYAPKWIMIKIRRYGKTVLVKFENGRWTLVDLSSTENESFGMTSLTFWFASFFCKLLNSVKILKLN